MKKSGMSESGSTVTSTVTTVDEPVWSGRSVYSTCWAYCCFVCSASHTNQSGPQRNSRTSSSMRPSTLTARRTWWGRPSSYLSMTSARRYAGDEDSRASTSASASMMASGGASITNLRDVRTAMTQGLLRVFLHHLLAQALGSDVEHNRLGSLGQEPGDRRGQIDDDVDAHPRLVFTLRGEVVLDVLTPLVERVFRVPHHPPGTPVVLEVLLVGDAHELERRPDVAWLAVGVPVDNLGVFVHRRPRRHRVDVGERVQNRFGRRVENDFSRCSSDSHTGTV